MRDKPNGTITVSTAAGSVETTPEKLEAMANAAARQAEEKEQKFFDAPEVKEIAHELIPRHHPHLVEARIKYLFRRGNWTSKGRTRLGQAVKVSERDRVIHGYDFVVIINYDYWPALDEDQRRALVDHELCHCERNEDAQGNPKWNIRAHDVEEFQEIVRRHGLWKPDLQQLERVMKARRQVELFGDGQDPAEDEAAVTTAPELN